jgi:hypothetical protein
MWYGIAWGEALLLADLIFKQDHSEVYGGRLDSFQAVEG